MFFQLFTASVWSRPPGPPAVPWVFISLFLFLIRSGHVVDGIGFVFSNGQSTQFYHTRYGNTDEMETLHFQQMKPDKIQVRLFSSSWFKTLILYSRLNGFPETLGMEVSSLPSLSSTLKVEKRRHLALSHTTNMQKEFRKKLWIFLVNWASVETLEVEGYPFLSLLVVELPIIMVVKLPNRMYFIVN